MDDSEVYDKNENIEFMPVSIKDEIQRGILHQCTYKENRPTSHRIYTAYEEKMLPLAGREYLLELEHDGYISPLQREWIIDSILTNAELAKLKNITMRIIISIVFLVLSIESINRHDLSGKTVSMQEASLKAH